MSGWGISDLAKLHPRYDANREARIKLAEQIADQQARIAELEAAIDKLDQCKGRYHAEANYKALIEVRNKSLHK